MATAKKHSYFYANGRRKSANARVRVSTGKGEWTINDQPADKYFASSKYLITVLNQPFSLLEQNDKFNVSVKVAGGGHNSQAEAISQGVAKALVQVNEDFKGTLKRAGLIGRDPREKERKKFGLKGARKKRQFTKR